MLKKLSLLISLSLVGVVLGSQTVFAVGPVSTATQYMNDTQIINGQWLANKPVTVEAPAGAKSLEQGWTIYSNSVNDGNTEDIEFWLRKDFSANNFEKRYCVEALDVAPFGIKGKLELWINEYQINPNLPYDLITSPREFVPTTSLTSQYSKVCTAWTTVQGVPSATNVRGSVISAVVVKQGAVKLRSASIESR